jgi:hypothetical protein
MPDHLKGLSSLSAEYRIHVERLRLPEAEQKDFVTYAMKRVKSGQKDQKGYPQEGGAITRQNSTIDRIINLYLAVDNEQDSLKLFRYLIFFGKGVETFMEDFEAKSKEELQDAVKTIPDYCWNAVSI